MITVLCVFRSGGEFTAEYVTRLRDGVEKHLSLPHRFVCLTDAPVDGVDCLPLTHNWPGWWSKVEIFRPDLPFGRTLYIDLSSVVVGSLDEMASQEGTVITADWYYGTPSQSVLLYDVGDFAMTWEAFCANPVSWMERGDRRIPPDFGDQILMNHTPVPPMRHWQDVLPGHLVSFKVHGVPDGTRLVKFHGSPRPHDVNWLEDVQFAGTLNTPETMMLEQARANARRGLPMFAECPAHDRAMVLVAGGPSLEAEMLALRFVDGDVFALNGAHDFLIERNLVPSYMVLLDARQENVRFVSKPHPDVTYLISAVCHPAVFDAVDGHKVTMWVNDMTGIHEAVESPVYVGGGATVGMKTMYLGYLMGYRTFHLFGFDSSYDGEKNHAYQQSLNDGENVVDVYVGTEHFRAAPWMAKQAMEFQKQARVLIEHGCQIHVHGSGLLPAVARHMTT